MCEALGVRLFPRNVPEMLLHLDWLTGIDEHELGHTHGHIAVAVNEKLTQEVTRANSEVWRRRLYPGTDLGRAGSFFMLQRSFPRAE